jgi:peptide/nickel transport system permease protein
MLSDGRDYIRNYPHISIAPGIAITLTVLAFNLIGDGLRDALDPRQRD